MTHAKLHLILSAFAVSRKLVKAAQDQWSDSLGIEGEEADSAYGDLHSLDPPTL
jgi:hypothetical protein